MKRGYRETVEPTIEGLSELEEYELTHNIPVLAPQQQKAIKELKKQTGSTESKTKY